jgi:hypothetical protein
MHADTKTSTGFADARRFVLKKESAEIGAICGKNLCPSVAKN